MSLLGTLGKLASSVAKAYSDASKKKNNSSSSNKTSSSSSYKPLGSNTDEYIRQTNSSDYDAIQAAKTAYQEAAKVGDQAGMTNANKAANDIRAKYGYSGGSDGSQYIAISQPKVETNPYEDAMSDLQNRYDKLAQQQQQANALAVKQGQQRLENQKYGINQAYDDSARQAYIANMQSKKNLPQQLAYSGATGGATETANLGLQTSYENNLNNINMNRANALNDIDNAIIELQNNGDLTAAQQALNNSQQALSAYQNLLANKINYDANQQNNEFNAQLATIGQYADDYQAEINRRMAINPNDPLIPYLAAARQEKIKAQEQAEAEATNSAIEQQEKLAWQLFQETGISNAFIESVLGIPQGTTTMDYNKVQSDIKNNNSLIESRKNDGGDGEKKVIIPSYSAQKNYIDNNFAIVDYAGDITYDTEAILNYVQNENSAGRLSDQDAINLLYNYGMKDVADQLIQ